MLVTKQKQFLDAVTDFEDALQRMAILCREAGEHDVALAASDAADHLLVLASLTLARGSVVPVPDLVMC